MGGILLTGAAGFIGSHLLERLRRERRQVVAVDNFDPYYDAAIKRANLQAAAPDEFHELDICDEAALEKLLKRRKFDLVVHLAARAGVRASLEQPALYERLNVGGTLRLLEACRRFGIPRLVFASSSSVYGAAGTPFRESDEDLAPLSIYGATKLVGEHYCRVFHRLFGLRVTVLRFFTVYGPRQRPDMAFPKFARAMLRGEPVPMFGAGRTLRDYTYISDIIDGVVAAIDRDEPWAVYNLGNSKPVPLREALRALQEALGVKAVLRRLPEQAGDPKVTCADISRARKNLGFRPRVPFEEGIRRFAEWVVRDVALRG